MGLGATVPLGAASQTFRVRKVRRYLGHPFFVRRQPFGRLSPEKICLPEDADAMGLGATRPLGRQAKLFGCVRYVGTLGTRFSCADWPAALFAVSQVVDYG